MHRRKVLWRLLVSAIILPVGLSAQTKQIVVEAAMARSIEDRMPVDTASVFATDIGTVWLWSLVIGAAGQTIAHVWKHGDDEWSVRLNVAGSPWRTFSSKVIPPNWTGEWSVEVRDEADRVLKRVRFTVRE